MLASARVPRYSVPSQHSARNARRANRSNKPVPSGFFISGPCTRVFFIFNKKTWRTNHASHFFAPTIERNNKSVAPVGSVHAEIDKQVFG